jgi:hypothetical protein
MIKIESIILFMSFIYFITVLTFRGMRYNGWQLPEGDDFEALHCQPSTNFDRSTKLDLTTESPLLGGAVMG